MYVAWFGASVVQITMCEAQVNCSVQLLPCVVFEDSVGANPMLSVRFGVVPPNDGDSGCSPIHSGVGSIGAVLAKCLNSTSRCGRLRPFGGQLNSRQAFSEAPMVMDYPNVEAGFWQIRDPECSARLRGIGADLAADSVAPADFCIELELMALQNMVWLSQDETEQFLLRGDPVLGQAPFNGQLAVLALFSYAQPGVYELIFSQSDWASFRTGSDLRHHLRGIGAGLRLINTFEFVGRCGTAFSPKT
ncbi:hypothetical protein OIU74_026165, partial [Salix koriyanagi]